MWKNYVNLPRSIHVLCLGTFINRAGSMLIPFLTIYLKDELQLGAAFATQAMGAFGVGAFFAAIFGGHLADRLGRRPVMLISLFGGAVVLTFFGAIRSPATLLFTSAVFAFLSEMYRPAASAMIGDLVDPAHRPHAFGLMYFSINLGFTVAPVVGGVLAKYSFQWLFWGDALTCAFYGVIIALAIRETLPARGEKTPQATRTAFVVAEPDPEEMSLPAAVTHILADRVFVGFLAGSFLVSVVFMQALSTFPLYFVDQGHDATTYGRVIALNGLMIVCLQLSVTSLVSRYRRSTMLVWGTVFMAVGFGLNDFAVTVWQFAGTVVIWTAGELMLAPLTPAIVSDLAPVHLRGRYMGAFTMCHSGAMMIGVPLGGYVLAEFGSSWVWGGCFVLALAGGLSYWNVRHGIAEANETPAG